MKVIQINCTYPRGSTGQLADALHRRLQEEGIESRVWYGRGEAVRRAGVRKLCPEWYARANHLFSRFHGFPYGGCLLSTWRLFALLRREKPEIVHLHCINGYFVNIYRLIAWLKKRGIRTVLTLHGEFFYTANCGNAKGCQGWRTGCGNCPRLRQETGSLLWDGTAASFRRMREAFRGFKEAVVVSVSPWLRSRAEQSPILSEMNHITIENGVDTSVFACRREDRGKTVFHATPLFSAEKAHPKGGGYVLELAARMPDVSFLVAGKSAVRGPVPENVTLLGEIRDPEVMARCYAGAGVTLLTSKAETFSLVCAESLCCGTPTAGFCCGGAESIALAAGSAFVPQGDVDALERALRNWLDARVDREALAAEAALRYSRERMLDRYIRLYRGLADDRPC